MGEGPYQRIIYKLHVLLSGWKRSVFEEIKAVLERLLGEENDVDGVLGLDEPNVPGLHDELAELELQPLRIRSSFLGGKAEEIVVDSIAWELGELVVHRLLEMLDVKANDHGRGRGRGGSGSSGVGGLARKGFQGGVLRGNIGGRRGRMRGRGGGSCRLRGRSGSWRRSGSRLRRRSRMVVGRLILLRGMRFN